MAETVNTNQFKNGMHIELDGAFWRIVEFQHVKPGKGGAFVRTKLKGLDTGAVVDRTFRAGEKFPRVRTETKDMQYLYDAEDEVDRKLVETLAELRLERRLRPLLLPLREPADGQSDAAVLPDQEIPGNERALGFEIEERLGPVAAAYDLGLHSTRELASLFR